jgi:hypothetical protein
MRYSYYEIELVLSGYETIMNLDVIGSGLLFSGFGYFTPIFLLEC